MSDSEKTSEEILAKEAQSYIDLFKTRMKIVAEDILGDLYINLVPHIETDAWLNYRNKIRDALCSDYARDEWLKDDHPWAREFRQKILREHPEALIDGLNKDLMKQVKYLQEMLNRRRDY